MTNAAANTHARTRTANRKAQPMKTLQLFIRDLRSNTMTEEDTFIGDIGPEAEGTDATVAAMWGILKTTMQRQVGTPGATWTQGPQSVYDYLKTVQRFTADPIGTELIRTPKASLYEIDTTGTLRGDCDDIAMLGVYMLAAQHIRPVLVCVGTRGANRFKHIFFGYRFAGRAGETATPQTVALMDPQENGEIGHWPADMTMRIYEPTGPHAPHAPR
jgi:hypothetical protein